MTSKQVNNREKKKRRDEAGKERKREREKEEGDSEHKKKNRKQHGRSGYLRTEKSLPVGKPVANPETDPKWAPTRRRRNPRVSRRQTGIRSGDVRAGHGGTGSYLPRHSVLYDNIDCMVFLNSIEWMHSDSLCTICTMPHRQVWRRP